MDGARGGHSRRPGFQTQVMVMSIDTTLLVVLFGVVCPTRKALLVYRSTLQQQRCRYFLGTPKPIMPCLVPKSQFVSHSMELVQLSSPLTLCDCASSESQ